LKTWRSLLSTSIHTENENRSSSAPLSWQLFCADSLVIRDGSDCESSLLGPASRREDEGMVLAKDSSRQSLYASSDGDLELAGFGAQSRIRHNVCVYWRYDVKSQFDGSVACKCRLEVERQGEGRVTTPKLMSTSIANVSETLDFVSAALAIHHHTTHWSIHPT
jgi:hypothetical protein